MSHHSRSSSEIETTTLQDVFHKFLKEFMDDFSLYDVKDSLKSISEEEMRLLLGEADEKKQVLQLFWILYESEEKLNEFLTEIKFWYPWLSEKVFRERNTISKDTETYKQAVQDLRSYFQKHSGLNVHRMEYYWEIRSALRKLKHNKYLVVSGELGVGKKWLVVDVLSEYSVMNTMGSNVFWLDVHNCNSKEEDFRALQKFRMLISERDSESPWLQSSEIDGIDNKILYFQQDIRRILKKDTFKSCLLVLSDVQNSKTWKAFNFSCKVLIITRNKEIVNSLSKSSTTHIPIVDGLSQSECFQLFEKVLQCKRDSFHSNITDIFRESSGHPYLLNIIANNLKLNKKHNCEEWLQNLQIANNKLTKVVELSLKVLNLSDMKLYKTLGIFPHSIKIPLKLLAAIWDKPQWEAGPVLTKFDKYSIINSSYLPDDSAACILPYVYSSYLKADLTIDRTTLHRKVVKYYGIREALDNRKEVDMFALVKDYYFFHCIGYHLRESKSLDLFPRLFLDFGFLEEKLRSDGFPNTIGDLNYFQKEITNNDPDKNKLLSELLIFLPTIEEILFRSEDTCLLQYALMADGVIKEQAEKLATMFYDKMWFAEKGYFHQRRQMVCLTNKPKFVKLSEADICVIALDNNEILLCDLSLGYNNGPVYLTGNQYPITKMELILKDNNIITLDVKGNLKVWSIADYRRFSPNHNRNNRTKVNPLNLTQRPLKRTCLQVEHRNARGAIQTFYIDRLDNSDLHLAFENGDICIYSWNAQREKFESKGVPVLATKVPKIHSLTKILNKYYMVLGNSGKIYFYNLFDSSKTAHSFEWPEPQNLVYFAEYTSEIKTHLFFVCRDKILCLTFLEQRFHFLNGDLETVFDINSSSDSGNTIICARLSRDGCYLVLGTKRGLIVFNTEQKAVVLRGNISECIACVDIYALDDPVFKYAIICGLEYSKALNLFALRQLENNTIAWSHRLSNISGPQNGEATNSPQFEPDAWLQGNKLFDLNYKVSVLLVAVDSKNRIHQLCTTDTKDWSISIPPESSAKITALTAYNNTAFCGYANGQIFNITSEVFLPSFTEKSITFLQMINENSLVASSKEVKRSIVRRIDGNENSIQKDFAMDIFKCFTVFESYLILINTQGGFIAVDLKNGFKTLYSTQDVPNSSRFGDCDLKNNFLIIATVNFDAFIYKFSICDGKLQFKHYLIHKTNNNEKRRETDEVTCLTSSSKATLLAVGLKSGTIELYKIENNLVRLIFRLFSHSSKIYDMKFSPNNEILVSCSEQLCFWHISYILNNPSDSDTKQKRRSSRFRSSQSPAEEVSDPISELNNFDHNDPWSNKRGPNAKPELLSCIKFVGNKAEIFYANHDFTQFNTIDNEGVYYHLCVHDISWNVNSSVSNASSYYAIGDDEVIT